MYNCIYIVLGVEIRGHSYKQNFSCFQNKKTHWTHLWLQCSYGYFWVGRKILSLKEHSVYQMDGLGLLGYSEEPFLKAVFPFCRIWASSLNASGLWRLLEGLWAQNFFFLLEPLKYHNQNLLEHFRAIKKVQTFVRW